MAAVTARSLDSDAGIAGEEHAVRSLLEHQVRAVFDDVDQAETALATVPPNAELRARVDFDYQRTFEQQRKRCLALEQKVIGGAPVAECWEDLRRLRGDLRSVLPETLAFIQGALAREHGLAADVTHLADGLVAELASNLPVEWRRFTLLADREYVGGPAQIIRLRFPETTLWSLPLLAHELGHFVGPRLGHEDLHGDWVAPLRQMLAAAAAGGPGAEDRMHELFADVFATWTVGPAFAMACLFLRFDPSEGSDSIWASHPDDVERMHTILRTLRRIGAPATGATELVDDLALRWNAATRASGANARSLATDQLDVQVDEVIGILEAELPAHARYTGWAAAELLATQFQIGAARADLPTGARLWHVVNAAWLWRSRAPMQPDRSLENFAGQVRDLCVRALHAGKADE